MNFDKKAAAITVLHLEMVSGVGELPTSWLPHTQTMGMAGLRLLYTFFRSASCLARISGCFSAKASTRSPQTTKKAGLGCKLLRMSTLCLHSSTFGNVHLKPSCSTDYSPKLPPSPIVIQGMAFRQIRPFQNCTSGPAACQLPKYNQLRTTCLLFNCSTLAPG